MPKLVEMSQARARSHRTRTVAPSCVGYRRAFAYIAACI